MRAFGVALGATAPLGGMHEPGGGIYMNVNTGEIMPGTMIHGPVIYNDPVTGELISIINFADLKKPKKGWVLVATIHFHPNVPGGNIDPRFSPFDTTASLRPVSPFQPVPWIVVAKNPADPTKLIYYWTGPPAAGARIPRRWITAALCRDHSPSRANNWSRIHQDEVGRSAVADLTEPPLLWLDDSAIVSSRGPHAERTLIAHASSRVPRPFFVRSSRDLGSLGPGSSRGEEAEAYVTLTEISPRMGVQSQLGEEPGAPSILIVIVSPAEVRARFDSIVVAASVDGMWCDTLP